MTSTPKTREWDGNGSLIFEDEIQYSPTLQHERAAILAMANLAGLDLGVARVDRDAVGADVQRREG